MALDSPADYAFETTRLRVAPWHDEAGRLGVDLAACVAELLTPTTTTALPPDWHGSYDQERAAAWISERDRESPTLLVSDGGGAPLGLLIVFAAPTANGSAEVRLGYLIAEEHWGRGYATELVGGVVGWARAKPSVGALVAGVELSNHASVRVLESAGFMRAEEVDTAPGAATYRLNVGPPTRPIERF